jgi:hypothetical protein
VLSRGVRDAVEVGVAGGAGGPGVARAAQMAEAFAAAGSAVEVLQAWFAAEAEQAWVVAAAGQAWVVVAEQGGPGVEVAAQGGFAIEVAAQVLSVAVVVWDAPAEAVWDWRVGFAAARGEPKVAQGGPVAPVPGRVVMAGPAAVRDARAEFERDVPAGPGVLPRAVRAGSAAIVGC